MKEWNVVVVVVVVVVVASAGYDVRLFSYIFILYGVLHYATLNVMIQGTGYSGLCGGVV